MSGTRTGGIKAAQTILQRNPNHYKRAGSKGGRVKTPKGFACMSPERLAEVSAMGGKNSSRIRRPRY
jgi:general stress protein YciG